MLKELSERGFDIETRHHAGAILSVDFPHAVTELAEALLAISLPMSELIGSGGGEAPSTQRLRRRLAEAGWRKHNFTVETRIDGHSRIAVSHEIDHVRQTPAGTLALEVEWNNKDPFFDRDLENFQRLHALAAISVGIVVTRGAAMQAGLQARVADFLFTEGISSEEQLLSFGMKDRTARQREAVERAMARGETFAEAFARQFTADKFGPATTHWSKLEARVARGVGAPCPLLLIGLPPSVVTGEPPPDRFDGGLFAAG